MDRAVAARAPLRISLGGGGTDLPSHYSEHGGFVVSAAIDRHVHGLVAEPLEPIYRLKHLEIEEVASPDEIQHPILRAALTRYGGGPIELSSVGEVPPGTGLGSSGAYTVCILKALAAVRDEELAPAELAERACNIEIGDLGRTVGKQDQYAAAHGGVNALTFERDGAVGVRRLELAPVSRTAISERFLLFFTGVKRSAAEMLLPLVERRGDQALIDNLGQAADVARSFAAALESGDDDRFGELLNEGWRLKRERLAGISTPRIEELRTVAVGAGATGVSLMGAGGGGFLLTYTEDPAPLRAAMASVSASELVFGLDEDGCTSWEAG